MLSRLIAGATVGAFVLGGCSDPPPAALPPGALSAGTAEVSINGANVDTTHDVRCSSTRAVTTITTGDDKSGTTSAIDASEGLSVRFAEIRNVGGFTGSYLAQLDPAAEAQATGNTFLMTGTANGYEESNPSFRVSGKFSIRVAC